MGKGRVQNLQGKFRSDSGGVALCDDEWLHVGKVADEKGMVNFKEWGGEWLGFWWFLTADFAD